ncbi:MAG: Rieske (2Fe-2S) protein [Candidatus Omnitrophota bacterium]|nr:Rieske (2Fe-2S) protein [Candidatus Omnitrophota bacterium]
MSDPAMDKRQANGPAGNAGDGKVSRRDFLGMMINGGLLVTLGGMILPALRYLWPVTQGGPTSGALEVGRVDDIPVWGAKKVVMGGSAILVIRTPDQIKAFSASCTHLGCLVDWDGPKREILCPCHAGSFGLDGRVIAGPPPRPLPTYEVKVVDGKIFVTV